MTSYRNARVVPAVSFLLLVAFAAPLTGEAQTNRALLIGINSYTPPEGAASVVSRKWRDLDGTLNDVASMEALLQGRFGFDEITKLLDREATRDMILASIEKVLVTPSQPGDVALFYFAGHGSQVRNTASAEADGLDETIVPADAWAGATDIRDKELRDAFNRLLQKGVTVTLIFDSCHSGSITRGLPSGKSRYVEPDPRVISDPSDPPKPAELGALILSGAQDDEVARELVDGDGIARGAFSWALTRALSNAKAGESAEQVFLAARAMLRSTGATQEPVISGRSDRRQQSLFGGSDVGGGLHVPVIEAGDDGTVVLQGGLALGLREGAQLVNYGEDSTDVTRLEIVSADGMARSVATVVEANDIPEPGDVFEVETWVSTAGGSMRIHVPPSGGAYEELMQVVEGIGDLRSRENVLWIDDPTEQAPEHILSWTGASWLLRRPDGTAVDVGDAPDAASIAGHLIISEQGGTSLFVNIPPFVQFAERFSPRLSTAGNVEQVEDPSAADYLLMGRAGDGGLEYAWVLREATVGATLSAAPARTDWSPVTPRRLFAASLLANSATKLNVIWGWLHLDSPPDDGTFPYRFAGFENVDTGEFKFAGDTLFVREQYRLVLQTTFADLERARVKAVAKKAGKRFIYLFILDRNGDGFLLYPPEEFGNVENDISLFSDVPIEIKYPSEDGVLFEVSEPVGVDSFFLITTAEAIPQPGIFSFEGVRTRGPAAGEQTDLSRLFHAMGSGTRSAKQPVPTSWSLERITVKSENRQPGQ